MRKGAAVALAVGSGVVLGGAAILTARALSRPSVGVGATLGASLPGPVKTATGPSVTVGGISASATGGNVTLWVWPQDGLFTFQVGPSVTALTLTSALGGAFAFDGGAIGSESAGKASVTLTDSSTPSLSLWREG